MVNEASAERCACRPALLQWAPDGFLWKFQGHQCYDAVKVGTGGELAWADCSYCLRGHLPRQAQPRHSIAGPGTQQLAPAAGRRSAVTARPALPLALPQPQAAPRICRTWLCR